MSVKLFGQATQEIIYIKTGFFNFSSRLHSYLSSSSACGVNKLKHRQRHLPLQTILWSTVGLHLHYLLLIETVILLSDLGALIP